MTTDPNPSAEVSLYDHWMPFVRLVWDRRRWIAIVTFIVACATAAVSLIVPEWYRSTTVLLPETEKGKLPGMGGVSDLAALAGINIGGEGGLVKLYPAIIRSEAVLRPVIMTTYPSKRFDAPVNLIDFWQISEKTPERSYETAVTKLREELSVSLDNRTNVLTMSIEMKDAQVSADVLNNINQHLDTFIRTKRTTNATEQRKWIEQRMVEVKADLEKAENAVKQFREKNRRVSDSPQLLLEQERLLREVQINSTLYIELKKQYEIAKIEEIKNLPIINVLDAAHPAALRSSPRRMIMTLIGSIVGGMLALLWVFVDFRYPSIASSVRDLPRRVRKGGVLRSGTGGNR